jgi:hypothetical protein
LIFYESLFEVPLDQKQTFDSFHRQTMTLVNPVKIDFPDFPEATDQSTKFSRQIAFALEAGVSAVVAPMNNSRTGLVLRNNGNRDVYISLGATATTANAVAVINPEGYYELAPSDYNGVVSAVALESSSLAGSELASESFTVAPSLVGSDIGNGIFFSLSSDLLKRKEGSEWLLVDSNVTTAKYRNGRVVYLVNGDTQSPKISSSSNNWIPVVGSANDWSPDEDSSPVVAA